LKKKCAAAGEKRMTERMAVRTGGNVQPSALHCNRNTLNYAAVLMDFVVQVVDEEPQTSVIEA
jgi:hypothetical protein